jgi:hypothetical protein
MVPMMKTYDGAGVPSLVEPQCYISQAEVRTGIVLTLEGKRRDKRENAPYILIFDNLEEAEKFAEIRVAEFPEIECHIANHSGQHLTRVFRKRPIKTVAKSKSRWWKFWRR